MEKGNIPIEHGQPMKQTKYLLCTSDAGVARCQSQHFDVRSVLHGQVSLAAVNKIYAVYEAMNGHKNLKIH